MRFLLCLSPLAVLPFVAAAPVPKVAPDFSHTCTAADLAKLTFVDADPEPKEEPESSEAKAARFVGVAVHLPRATIEEGDPIPALFVVRNRADKPHGLWMHFDFAGRHAAGACGVTVRNTKTDTVTGPFAGRATMCGGPHWAIPAKGYWTTGGNVGVSSDGKPLPVGDYELTWRYAGTTSKAVQFTVIARRLGRPAPEPAARPLRAFEVRPGEEDKPLDWHWATVREKSFAELAHALGTGGLGAYHPDLHELPAAAGGLRAVTKWDGDSLQVTLDSPNGVYDSLECRKPVLYLIAEAVGDRGDQAEEAEPKLAAGDRKAGDDLLKLPATFDVRLPKGWRDKADAAEGGRVSVLVASREPPAEFAPNGFLKQVKELERVQKVVRAVGPDERANPPKPKGGDWVLKTEWQVMKKPGVRK